MFELITYCIANTHRTARNYRWTAYRPPQRWHDGAWAPITLPVTGAWGVPIADIFAQDGIHTWFNCRYANPGGPDRKRLPRDAAGGKLRVETGNSYGQRED